MPSILGLLSSLLLLQTQLVTPPVSVTQQEVPVNQTQVLPQATHASQTATAASASADEAVSIAEESYVPKVLAYYVEYSENDQRSYSSLSSYSSYISDISVAMFNATAEGSLNGRVPAAALELAHSHQINAYLCLTNHGEKLFDKRIAHAILTNPEAQSRLIGALLETVKKHRFAGVNLDFENVPASDRDAYTQFVKQLAERLHQQKKQLIVSVPAKTADLPSHSWTYGFDYAGIGRYSDYVQVMTYDQHGPWSEAGPVAAYPWVDQVVGYTASQIPAEKILLGIPSYGYEWSPTRDRAVTYTALPDLIKRTGAQSNWDEGSQSPYLTYTTGDGSHIVWYEDERSIDAKQQLAKSSQLAGYGVWRLGFEDASFWNALLE
ncbi:glycoside hydrolase family 18 [Brevibacillus humidisoli]|uniref:glycosyl hydrolase family 18 protein n=1 Tax=Brevibacillus humidisoli TaxID=2895522 RepID=UPI001E4E9F1E|nr:glycosyl hydrolase family 18 protein [Brevibacillus humidisoli]UFJ41195.1 glycoside hydrolase family 18 [Brevibacillus humidisoli]